MPTANAAFIRENSPFADALLERYPDWLGSLEKARRLDTNSPPRGSELETLIEKHGLSPGLRLYRNREMLRITWRELCRLAPVQETLTDLSTLAEVCLNAALLHHQARLTEKFGSPLQDDGTPASLAVLAMGKLGGRELNLSSDIDLMFAFSSTGTCQGRHRLSNEQFFTRLVRAVIKDLSEINEHGFCFRVDARLRPFGESGPLVCSFGAMEQYYQREGRDWERYAMIKARPVAGDLASGHELLLRLRPFVYRRYIDFGAIEALHDMHDALRADASKNERQRDVKRGPGGIREIEFLVQAFQLLRGGREPGLQTTSLLAALHVIDRNGNLPPGLAGQLEQDYLFLRQVENAIQALHDRQDHILPDGEDLERVNRIMRRAGCENLEPELLETRRRVIGAFESCFPRNDADNQRAGAHWQPTLAGETQKTTTPGSSLDRFVRSLKRHSLSARAQHRLDRLMPALLEKLEGHQFGQTVEDDVFNLVLAICRRSAYLALLTQNPAAMERMLGLFHRSEWISNLVIRHPVLLDELIDPALGKMLPDQDEIRRNTQRILSSHDDPEHALLSLNDAKQAFHLRIAVAELESSLSVHDVQLALTWVAEAIVDCCYRMAQKAVQEKHGRLPVDELTIVGYGTLGANTLSYDSDLDLIFLFEPCAHSTDGDKPVDAERYHTAIVRRLLSLLTSATPSGRLFEVDTRLRPNGRSGLLVSSLPAFEKYQRKEAWTWELQALCRGRPCAGSNEAGKRFDMIRNHVLSQARDPGLLHKEIMAMRQRMRDANTGGDDLKHGEGGLVDIEFVTQMGLLLNAHVHPGCLANTSTAKQLEALFQASWISGPQLEALLMALSQLTAARHLKLLSGGRREISPPRTRAGEVCAQLLKMPEGD